MSDVDRRLGQPILRTHSTIALEKHSLSLDLNHGGDPERKITGEPEIRPVNQATSHETALTAVAARAVSQVTGLHRSKDSRKIMPADTEAKTEESLYLGVKDKS